MSTNTNGFEYEGVVIDALATAGHAGNILEGAGASAAAADADFSHNGKIHLVEVKLNSKAQMGGSSVRLVKGVASLVKPTSDTVLDDLLVRTVEGLNKPLTALLHRLSELEGRSLESYPFQCAKDNWAAAQAEDLLVNTKLSAPVDFIQKHYRSKGVNYIQLGGGAGLFHLGNNPAALPVPELMGTVKLEVRTARGGSKVVKSTGERRVTGAIRVQARLSLTGKSNYTLDDPESIRALFSAS